MDLRIYVSFLGMVKEEMSWFGSLPVTLTAGGKPIEMALVNKVKDILLSAQNDKALDVLNGYSAREVASAVGNRWVDSGVIDLISSLINKEAHSLNVTAKRVKYQAYLHGWQTR
eukprot:Seg22813.1 transcript_id=Seg22813.1/GoldUCD/mRNA.D3Y31 product="hypothetical protein" protein_id=Seg22813.1/GoldUCD/D3Y31